MRKLKLLLAACALFGVTATAWAQTDVTNTYLPNPSFESDGLLSASNGTDPQTMTLTGWTQEQNDPGNYQDNKICDASTENGSNYGKLVTPSDGTYYLFYRHGWNGSNYAKFTSTSTNLPAGNYTLTVDYKMVSGSDNSNNNLNTSITLSAISGETILGSNEAKDAVQVNNNGTTAVLIDNNWSTLTTMFSISEETSTQFVINLLACGPKRSDFVIDNVKLMYSTVDKAALNTAITNATTINAVIGDENLASAITTAQGVYDNDGATQSAVDDQVTALGTAITTAYGNIPDGKDLTGFIKNAVVANTDGWVNGRINSGQQYTGAPDNTYMDTWNGTLNQKQSIQLPAGFYLLKAATRADATLTAAGNIYALVGEDNYSTDIERKGASGNLLGSGWAWTRVRFQVSTLSDVTIGFYSECGGGKWAGADNFTLTYYTSQDNLNDAVLSQMKNDWAPALEGKVPTAAITAINNAQTVDEANTAITNARGLVDAYASYLSVKSSMDAIALVETTDPSKAASRKAEYLDAVSAEAENATTVEAINTAIGNIKDAVVNYVKKLTPADPDNAPFDLTFMITNPSFANNNANGWTVVGGKNNGVNAVSYGAAEFYMQNFDISQTLTNMATGSYRLNVKAFQRVGPGWKVNDHIVPIVDYFAQDPESEIYGVTAEIYVNGGNEGSQKIKNSVSAKQTSTIGGAESSETIGETTYYIPNNMEAAVKYFDTGLYENQTEIIATTNTVKFGFRCSNGTGDGFWTIFDDFRLYYTGQIDLSVFAENLAAKVVEANNVKTNLTGKVPAAALNALQTAIDDNDNDDNAFDEEEQFTSAIRNLEAAIEAAEALQTSYSAWTTMKGKADVLVAVDNDNAEANGALTTDINNQNTAVEAATAAVTVETATAALKDAMKTYVFAASPVGEGKKFDCTFMLTNPDLSVFKANGAQAGWFTDQTFETQNSQVMQSNTDVANTADPSKYAMYEYWSDASCATSGYTVYTKITLPEGTYKMEALCMSGWGWNASAANGARSISFSAGDVDGTEIVTATLEPATLDFVQTTEEEVKIGLKAHEGNTCNWMGIGYVQLFKVPAVEVTIDEDVAYTPESKAGKVTLKRTLTAAKWNTFVVPFQITNEELKETFGEDVAVAEYSEVADEVIESNSTVSFNTMETPAITANKPVLLKPATVAAENEYVFLNRTVAIGETKVAGTNFDFIGSYAASTEIVEGDYYLNNDKLWKSKGLGSTIKGTRAYIGAKSAGARILSFSIDGVVDEATAVEGVNVSRAADGKLYNLNGQQVKKGQKGIFIQNNQKVIVR